MTLEKMDSFFEARVGGYDEHMLSGIEGAREFYPLTAFLLPVTAGAKVLDLGCGTGLELGYYFEHCPDASVTGIDLTKAMLDKLEEKFSGRDLNLIQGSYFDVDLGADIYDAAVSVESLHHFTGEEKLGLYCRLRSALKDGGYFILTDYFAVSDEQEKQFADELAALRKEQGLTDGFIHFDTPLTAAHETEILLRAGFGKVEDIASWGATHVIKAIK